MKLFVLVCTLGLSAATDGTVNVNLTGRDQIMQWKGKRVTLVLRSGKELEGTVGEVSSANVELKQLVGKEFYDAVVKQDEIAAFVYRTKP